MRVLLAVRSRAQRNAPAGRKFALKRIMLPHRRKPRLRRLRDGLDEALSSLPVLRLVPPEDAELEPTKVAPGTAAAGAQTMMDGDTTVAIERSPNSCIREIAGPRAPAVSDITLVHVQVLDLGLSHGKDAGSDVEELSDDDLIEDDDERERQSLASLVARFESVPATIPPPPRPWPSASAPASWHSADDVAAFRPKRGRAIAVLVFALASVFGLLVIFAR